MSKKISIHVQGSSRLYIVKPQKICTIKQYILSCYPNIDFTKVKNVTTTKNGEMIDLSNSDPFLTPNDTVIFEYEDA